MPSLLLAQIHGGRYQNNLKGFNLKGPVKTCITYFYEKPQTDTGITQGSGYNLIVSYRPDGRALGFYLSDTITQKNIVGWSIVYNKKGREISNQNTSGKVISTTKYKTNKQHNLVEIQYTDRHRISSKIIYSAQGLPDTVYGNDNAGVLMNKTVYRYSAPNIVIEKSTYDASGKFKQKVIFGRDNIGRNISETTYDDKDSVTFKVTYAYDEHDNVIMERDSSENSIHIGGFYVYEWPTGKYDISLRTSRFFNYDKYGNWLQEDVLIRGVPAKTIKRKIEYYK